MSEPTNTEMGDPANDSRALFSQRHRSDSTPSRHGESIHAFLERAAGAFWDQCRDLISAWLGAYPASDRTALQSRLRSEDNQVFTSAFWELYLHEAYRLDGWTIQVEPAVPNSSNRPDFLVSKNGHTQHYVEARCTFASMDRAAGARLDVVYAALDGIDSGAFHIAVTPVRVGATSPSTRRLRRDLEAWLRGLDPDRGDFSLGADGSGPNFDWRHEDWHLSFRPLPRRAAVRHIPANRPLGAFIPDSATFVDDIGALRVALLDKESKYGALEHPLVLAINIGSGFHDDDDTVQALYGTVGWRFDFGNLDADPTPIITEAGFWGPPGQPARTHIAGVLVAIGMHYGRVAHDSPIFWPNPGAATTTPLLPLWVGAQAGRAGIDYQQPQRAAHDYFQLPEGWPLGDAFPRGENPVRDGRSS